MKVSFYLYNGLAGDPDLLLVGVNTYGKKISYLWNKTSWLGHWNMRRLKIKILKQFELESGVSHEEDLK